MKRLELLGMEYARLTGVLRELMAQLADMGVIATRVPPRIEQSDSMEVLRHKERIIRVLAQRRRIWNALEALDAEIVDVETMEILLPGGPDEGSFLSWQIGESYIGYWRKSKTSDRIPLTTGGNPPQNVVFH